jgi:hypothetical protein
MQPSLYSWVARAMCLIHVPLRVSSFQIEEVIQCIPSPDVSPERVQWTAAAASRKEILQTCASRYNIEPPKDADAIEGNEEEGVWVSVSIQNRKRGLVRKLLINKVCEYVGGVTCPNYYSYICERL